MILAEPTEQWRIKYCLFVDELCQTQPWICRVLVVAEVRTWQRVAITNFNFEFVAVRQVGKNGVYASFSLIDLVQASFQLGFPARVVAKACK
jgi:hypothetical protein